MASASGVDCSSPRRCSRGKTGLNGFPFVDATVVASLWTATSSTSSWASSSEVATPIMERTASSAMRAVFTIRARHSAESKCGGQRRAMSFAGKRDLPRRLLRRRITRVATSTGSALTSSSSRTSFAAK